MGKAKSTGIDLWTPIVSDDRQHHNFRKLVGADVPGAKAVVSAWAKGFKDRDGKFVQEFQTSFDSAFWELYLHACFRELGFSCDFSHFAPDFVMNHKGGPLVAEAVIASHAEGYCPEWDKTEMLSGSSDGSLHQSIRYTTGRLAQAFMSKVQKYRDRYQKLAHVKDKPYLICIAPFDYPGTFDWALQSVRRVLYGVDQPIIVQNKESGEKRVTGASEVHTALKDSGAEFPVAFFRDPAFADVSAVLFSSTATWCKPRALSDDLMPNSLFRAERYNPEAQEAQVIVGPKPKYTEALTDGLMLFLNPYARQRFALEPFLDGKIALEGWNPWLEETEAIWPKDWLIRRFIFTLQVAEDGKKTERPVRREYKKIGRPTWKNGELRKQTVSMFATSENWMGHFDGWTVVIFKDATDGTWHGLAVEQIAHTLPEVIEINQNESAESVWRLKDHKTRKQALADVRKGIAEEIDSRRKGRKTAIRRPSQRKRKKG